MAFPVDNIRRGCKAKGITLAELERKLGFGNGVIARWETAKTAPPIDRLTAISEELEIPMDELCRAEENTPASVPADGLTASQKELIRLLPLLTDSEVTVLLTTVRSLIDGRTLGDSQ